MTWLFNIFDGEIIHRYITLYKIGNVSEKIGIKEIIVCKSVSPLNFRHKIGS